MLAIKLTKKKSFRKGDVVVLWDYLHDPHSGYHRVSSLQNASMYGSLYYVNRINDEHIIDVLTGATYTRWRLACNCRAIQGMSSNLESYVAFRQKLERRGIDLNAIQRFRMLQGRQSVV